MENCRNVTPYHFVCIFPPQLPPFIWAILCSGNPNSVGATETEIWLDLFADLLKWISKFTPRSKCKHIVKTEVRAMSHKLMSKCKSGKFAAVFCLKSVKLLLCMSSFAFFTVTVSTVRTEQHVVPNIQSTVTETLLKNMLTSLEVHLLAFRWVLFSKCCNFKINGCEKTVTIHVL